MSGQAQTGIGVKLAAGGYIVAEMKDNPVPPKFSRSPSVGTGQEDNNEVSLPGRGKWSPLTCEVYAIDDASQVYMEALRDSGAQIPWKIIRPPTWKAGGVLTPFKTDIIPLGWVSAWEPTLPADRATYKLSVTPVRDYTTGITTLGAGLSALSFANQNSEAITAFTPSFSATTYKYTVTAFSDDTGIKITPTGATGTIYVNGTPVTSGMASAVIPLNAGGTTTIYVFIVESDLKCPRIYQFDVTIGTVASPP
jgi:hypothetical protein